ncbi:MAG TPA: hypothetical protein DDY68_06440 [Porphyromonadaceae bacterium]|nr:hypothetical protein [Porphyromonadaceae bacterium]
MEDSILIKGGKEIILPTPRQSNPMIMNGEKVCLSLCDFVAPKGGKEDFVGIFAVSINEEIREEISLFKEDNYKFLLLRTLANGLVESGAEWLHKKIREELWRFPAKGIRPAVGYPCLPHQEAIFTLDELLPLHEIGIGLTEIGAMFPQSSICGLIFSHRNAIYFNAK